MPKLILFVNDHVPRRTHLPKAKTTRPRPIALLVKEDRMAVMPSKKPLISHF